MSNPHAIHSQRHLRWSTNVWAYILGNRMIGPYLLPERLTRHSYFVFHRDVLTDFLDDIPLEAKHCLWFQPDGASAYLSSPVRNMLDMEYPGHWIGRELLGFMAATISRSDTFDFFLWDYLKELVYQDLVTTESQLVARLHAACKSRCCNVCSHHSTTSACVARYARWTFLTFSYINICKYQCSCFQ
ncbi:hypothetical protein AVEN_159875-1 [Araneus ventricosus]|uniref:Uncharacterized protein n=1 Tax=Araneus ventricosus TaxID=182803 RepID=A0A4Y2E228_ARAVE|nr:hypothetical protein AVEN_159875-1 [Araneus ventricosus]